MAVYRVEFQIQRRTEDDDDFTEIGFGSSGAWDSIGAASFTIESMIQNREWETGPGMPDPDSFKETQNIE